MKSKTISDMTFSEMLHLFWQNTPRKNDFGGPRTLVFKKSDLYYDSQIKLTEIIREFYWRIMF